MACHLPIMANGKSSSAFYISINFHGKWFAILDIETWQWQSSCVRTAMANGKRTDNDNY
jgi:hypothetical protein